jgi:hypothetical protein
MRKILLQTVCIIFLFSAQVAATDMSFPPAQSNRAKINTLKVAKMHATGKVIEVSKEAVKIERTVKGDIETMEFILEKPLTGVRVNDSVRIEYTETDAGLMASKISRIVLKKKEIDKSETKSVPAKK